MIKKRIWAFVVCFAIFVLVSSYPVEVPCEQCGGTCIKECLMARFACNFQNNFIHFECLDAWCEDNPIQFDIEGNVIREKL